jgi:bacillolysin
VKKYLLFAALLVVAGIACGQTDLKFGIRGPMGVSNYYTAIPANQKINFASFSARSLFGVDANSDLVLTKTEQDKLGYLHYRYYQTYKGIPVENSMCVVHTMNGLLKGMTGKIILDFDPIIQKRSTASISALQAVEIAMRYVHAQLYAWKDDNMERSIKMQTGNKNASYTPAPKLVWYSPSENLNPRALRLAYKIDLYAIKPLSRADYFVDAITGKIIGKDNKIHFTDATGNANTFWSGKQKIHSDFTGTNYRLRDSTRGNGIITLHGESGQFGNDYTSSSSNWSLSGSNIAALDVHWGVSQSYAFYMAKFNRNSYDNAGAALISYVNDPSYIDSAFWDGNSMHFCKRSTGEGGGVTGIDIIAHELTHGVTQETCGLLFSNESGAIDESLSDIMGKSIQFWSKPTDINWQFSNDMNWVIRDMSKPNLLGQPDTYKGTDWYTGSGDNGGVHYNSGVGNFMFYLLVNGGTGTNDKGNAYAVTGIGLNKADQIIYRSQTVYLTSTSRYTDWRVACINAATDLYGSTSNELTQVKNAFFAVGIGSSATGCDAPTGLATSVITKNSATLGWKSVQGVSIYNLQWKLATDSIWTLVSNITDKSYNLTGLSAGFTYNFRVESICANGTTTSGFSDSASFTTTSGTNYCSSHGESTSFEYIQRFAIGPFGYTSGNNGGYGNFTNLVRTLKAGKSYTCQLTPGFAGNAYPENWTLYADLNRDGDFADANENLGSVTSTGSTAVSLSFTIPSTASIGRTRLRIQMAYGTTLTDPCTIFTNGEVEDYGLKMIVGSGLDAANIIESAENSSFYIQPNPVVKGASAQVAMQLPTQGKVTFKVTDLSGRLMLLQNVNNAGKGKNVFTLAGVAKLNRGAFMIVAEQNGVVVGRGQLIVE